MKHVHILECLIDLAQKELSLILKERREVLGSKICSVSTDFWTDSSHRESFGCIIADLQAKKYELTNGLVLFMSDATRERLLKRDEDIFVTGEGELSDLKYVLNFEHFDNAKTAANISNWLKKSTDAVNMKSDDINVTSADGASNAIGSLVDFEVETHNDRSTNQEFSICFAHQNQQAACYASGTGDFAENLNATLSNVLDKNHKSQVSTNLSCEI